nr:MAG TPA: hypothetical protein [Caudoviricetes sp.]
MRDDAERAIHPRPGQRCRTSLRGPRARVSDHR